MSALLGNHQTFFSNDTCPECPVCFNCNLERHPCENWATCNTARGTCDACPVGFGGEDCAVALCQSPVAKRRFVPAPDQPCECDDGWSGVNCNVCQRNDVCSFEEEGTVLNGSCYSGAQIVNHHFKSCQATLPDYIDDLLKGRQSRVTYECRATSVKAKEQWYEQQTLYTADCEFQFWLEMKEQFYCAFKDCEPKLQQSALYNISYECPHVACRCKNKAEICDDTQLIDISDMLKECNGPATVQCDGRGQCHFNELNMDTYFNGGIGLTCTQGECLRPSQLPGFSGPIKTVDGVMLAVVSGAALLLLFALIGLFVYLARKQKASLARDNEALNVALETDRLLDQHLPVTFVFKRLQYTIQERAVLQEVSGVVAPGQIMAIMGGSGAGKTTCLDILAGKLKRGKVSGSVFVNGVEVPPRQFRSLIGYVDQEDTLMGTLTVRETLMYSALLRLPGSMSLSAKKARVQQTMLELGIDHLADRRIGMPGSRGLSGGERRRVSIAQELVTSPSILFCDEPTSGLDSYNALMVVLTLVRLAKEYQRTVLVTIHQPRSNIFALFDRVLLLAHGRMIFSGPVVEVTSHFASLGYSCPPGYNTADYLIDVTMMSEKELVKDDELAEREASNSSDEALNASSQETEQNRLLSRHQAIEERVQELAQHFLDSPLGERLTAEIQLGIRRSSEEQHVAPSFYDPDVTRKASFPRQVMILSGRTLINLYRNPFLLFAHYSTSILLALLCGLLFWQVTDDTPGLQNRLGCLFFTLAFFGFGSLTSLELFTPERILFARERANGFYEPSAYFIAKVFFDMIPLRLIPPALFGAIIYYMVGLFPTAQAFFQFLLVLMLFNMVAAALCLCIAILCKQSAIGNLTASLMMLFSMLFGGFLLNKSRTNICFIYSLDNITATLSWIQYLSIFNYAFEALIVNEVARIRLHDKNIIEIDIPGSVILKQFGFDTTAYWRDVACLMVMLVASMTLAFILMKTLVKERR